MCEGGCMCVGDCVCVLSVGVGVVVGVREGGDEHVCFEGVCMCEGGCTCEADRVCFEGGGGCT